MLAVLKSRRLRLIIRTFMKFGLNAPEFKSVLEVSNAYRWIE
jgi:hypothetical protein